MFFRLRPVKLPLLTAFLFIALAPELRAQNNTPGVTTTSIRLGSCSALSGPASFLGIQTQMGALAYFHLVNDPGGVHCRSLELKSLDDGYDPEKAPACFNRLAKEDAFAMSFFVGTPTAAKYIPLAESEKIPEGWAFYRRAILYEPLKHYIVTVRPPILKKPASRWTTCGKSGESTRSE